MDNQGVIKTSFWDFKTPKTYTGTGEISLDFLAGWLIPAIIINYLWSQAFSRIIAPRFEQLVEIGSYEHFTFPLEQALPFLIPFIVLILLLIFGVFYFWKRRKYLAYGFLISLIFSVPSFIMIFSLL